MAHLVAPGRGERPKGRSYGEATDDPRACGAQRAVDAAKGHEGLIQRADGLAVREVPRDVAPDEQPAKRHDESRDHQIADKIAIKRPDQRPHDHARQYADPRDQRVTQPKSQHIRQHLRLGHGHDGRTGG